VSAGREGERKRVREGGRETYQMCNEKIWTPIKMVIDEPVHLIKRIYLPETRRKVGHRACSYDQMLL
jgi:hypothetical protein